jgi:hypothetical protein
MMLSVPLPDKAACQDILCDALKGLSKSFPKVKELAHSRELPEVAEICVGMDGRQIRKMIAAACTFSRDTAADPNRLSTADLRRAAEKFLKERKKVTA